MADYKNDKYVVDAVVPIIYDKEDQKFTFHHEAEINKQGLFYFTIEFLGTEDFLYTGKFYIR